VTHKTTNINTQKKLDALETIVIWLAKTRGVWPEPPEIEKALEELEEIRQEEGKDK